MRKHSVPLAQVLKVLMTLLYKLFTVKHFYKLFLNVLDVLKYAICELSLNEHFL